LAPLEPKYRRFLDQLIRNYHAAPYEIELDHPLYGSSPHQNWAVRHSQRFYHAMTTLAPFLRDGTRVVDLGAFPGSFLKILRMQYGASLDLVAAGMKVVDRFPSDMAALRIPFVPVDLDTVGRTAYPGRLALDDGSVGVVVCTEMIEHLYSVRPLFHEVTRILKPGGVLYLSTNNVAYLLGLLRLVRGETNLDLALEHTSALTDSEWRGHVRFYSLRQLRELAGLFGLSVASSGYLHLRTPREMMAPRAIRHWRLSRVFAALIAAFPVYQSHIWMLARKPL
jgi:SAM-dependent methyltransferase